MADVESKVVKAEIKELVGQKFVIELDQTKSFSTFSDGCYASKLRAAGLILGSEDFIIGELGGWQRRYYQGQLIGLAEPKTYLDEKALWYPVLAFEVVVKDEAGGDIDQSNYK